MKSRVLDFWHAFAFIDVSLSASVKIRLMRPLCLRGFATDPTCSTLAEKKKLEAHKTIVLKCGNVYASIELEKPNATPAYFAKKHGIK